MELLELETKRIIRDYFKELTFEEKPHKYYVNGTPISKSVSTLIKQFCLPFDEEEISKTKAEREQISQENLLRSWHEKRDNSLMIGKSAHLFGELYTFNRNLRPQTNFDLAIMKFWNSLPEHVVPVIVEQPMYHKVKLYAGTPDAILMNKETGKLIIIDYKTNEDLFKNFKGQKLTERFSTYLDNPFNKYQIQLSYYKILLEQVGYEVSSTKIIWIKPDATYTIYDTMDLTQYIK